MFVSKILSKIFFHTNNTTLNEMADFMFTRKTCARIQSGEPTDEGTNGSLRHPPLIRNNVREGSKGNRRFPYSVIGLVVKCLPSKHESRVRFPNNAIL